MRALRLTLACVLAVALTGCGVLGGGVKPENFVERLAVANGGVTGLVNSVDVSLNAQRIGSADAKYVSGVAKQSAAFLDAAEVASAQGETSTAQERLLLAESILTQLEAYLSKKGATP